MRRGRRISTGAPFVLSTVLTVSPFFIDALRPGSRNPKVKGVATQFKFLGPLRRALFAGAVASALFSGCTGKAPEASASSDASTVTDGGTCHAAVQDYPASSFQHVADCSPLTFATNPPSGGDHYADWAAYQNYDFPVPAGFLVHDLEHGAVVIGYNCPDGCAAEVAQAKAAIAGWPVDDACAGSSTARRVTLTPYPELTVRWAASSWGWTLRADCFDPIEFANFFETHGGQGREQTCAPGIDIQPDTCP